MIVTTDLIKKYVLTQLGDSDITVELTDDDWTVILQRTLFKYNKYRPKKITARMAVVQGKQYYPMDEKVTGRGIIDCIFPDIWGRTYLPFPTDYYPWSKVPDRVTGDFLSWNSLNIAREKVFGVQNNWEFDRDTKTLKLMPNPLQSYTLEYTFIQDREFEESIVIGTGDGTTKSFSGFIKNGTDIRYNILPQHLSIKCGNISFASTNDNTFVGSDGTSTGTINYTTGAYTLTFTTAPAAGTPITYSVQEIRSSDIDWYDDYALALAMIIVGTKRKRFSNIPGSQSSITLDTDMKTEGNTKLQELETRAKVWQLDYMVPRLL